MKKLIIPLLILITISGYGYYDLFSEYDVFGYYQTHEVIFENNLEPEIYFTQTSNVTNIMINLFEESNDISCAFYDLDDQNIIDVLKKKNAKVTIEDDNELDEFKTGRSSGKMHNKFCVLDNKTVITGSMNPTFRGFNKNDNNVLVIHSNYISKNYLDEFDELYNNQFGDGSRVKYPIITLNNKTLIKNLFCPDDDCQKHVLSELEKSEKSIYFMTFSFTDGQIADKLIEKNKLGVDVKGVFEKNRFNMGYEQYKYLNLSNVTIFPDKSGFNMHHKVFIVDNKTVITGSYNPTWSGNNKNDENILIITNKDIAKRYVEEFERLL